MNVLDLKRALVAFADDASDLDLSKGRLVVQIRDELIEASVEDVEGDLYVTEGGQRVRAFSWLVGRVARMPLLADRVLTHIPAEPHFVKPSGRLLDHLDERPDEVDEDVDDLPAKVVEVLSRPTAGTSTILYVTSDAGEGKTTLINELARKQAEHYKAKRATWLLLPISLGGRSFLTFDDIVVAELVNKLRFQLFYYEAFLELVRLRVIVPAFDGFEEMFVEGSSGEALSALGNLVNDLESSGSVLIAARKAYFEYQNFRTQAKLFDAIQGNSVAFARLGIDRWDRSRFLAYAAKRGLADSHNIYEKVCARLGKDHPLLTRAVLVERLVEVASDGGVDALLEHLGADPDDYFYQFVDTIVEREAHKKWIDRSGTPHRPLLSIEEHHALLAAVAREMWIASSEALRGDYLDLVAEVFVGEREKPPQVARQIVRRLRQHSLIVSEAAGGALYAFDHEDFRRFYLGESLGETLAHGDVQGVGLFLQKGALPPGTADAALNAVRRRGVALDGSLSLLQRLVASAAPASYVAENAGVLAVRLLELLGTHREVELSGFTFPEDSIKGRLFGKAIFRGCQFLGTSVSGSRLVGCRFERSSFLRLEWDEGFDAAGAVLDQCEISCVVAGDDSPSLFDPGAIRRALEDAGFDVRGEEVSQAELEFAAVQPDEDTLLAEHALRIFMRATHINEEVFQQKFGTRASRFFDGVLPRMLEAGVLDEVPYKGSGKQRRYQLLVPMRNIDAAVPASVASLDDFLRLVLAPRGSPT